MVPWELLEARLSPGARQNSPYKRGKEFSIRLNRCELMNSRMHGSEEALAELACARIADRCHPLILVAGFVM